MKTIAVIDDQAVMANAYRNKFQAEGFRVEVAGDGEQGLDLITRIKPDLVLLDMYLPKLSGLEVLKQVRANPDFKTLPIIVLSNLTQPGVVEDAWKAGATAVLSKLNTSPKKVLESVHAKLAEHAQTNPPALAFAESAIPFRTQTTPDGSHKGCILVVEEHSDTREILGFLLRQAGHQVTSVKNGAAALQQIAEQTFDLFVLSHGFPERAGPALCKQMRQSRPKLPIIVYSTQALFLDQQEGLKAGATAYLAKPEDLLNLGPIATEIIRSQVRLVPADIRAA